MRRKDVRGAVIRTARGDWLCIAEVRPLHLTHPDPPEARPMPETKRYTPKDFSNLKGLKGVNDETLQSHFTLYQGYVKRTNALTERLEGLLKEKKASGADPTYAELTRRLRLAQDGDGEELRRVRELARGLQGRGHHARRRLGGALSGSVHRLALQSLDHPPRDEQHRRLPADPGDRRVGARLRADLQAVRARQVHREHLQGHRLASGGEAAPLT